MDLILIDTSWFNVAVILSDVGHSRSLIFDNRYFASALACWYLCLTGAEYLLIACFDMSRLINMV